MPGINHLMVAAVVADLQPVAVVQIARQLQPGHAARNGFDRADGHAAVVHTIRINHPCILCAHGIAVHEAAAGENLREALALGVVCRTEGILLHQVDTLAIAGSDGCHIFGTLQAAFQLHRAGTRFHQIRQIIAHAHIAGAEPRGRFPPVSVGQSAGLGTASAVAASAADHGGEQALSGHRHALGAMAEHLDLDPDIRCLTDFRQRAFPGQHRAGQPMPLDKFHASGIVQRHLGGCMDGQIREAGAGQMHHAQILHQHRIHAHLIEQPQHFHHAGQLAVLDQRIHRHMDVHMMQMGKMHRLAKRVLIEIARTGSGRKSSVPQINRISACCYGTVEGFTIASRGKIL